jgi:hypothetical protein
LIVCSIRDRDYPFWTEKDGNGKWNSIFGLEMPNADPRLDRQTDEKETFSFFLSCQLSILFAFFTGLSLEEPTFLLALEVR